MGISALFPATAQLHSATHSDSPTGDRSPMQPYRLGTARTLTMAVIDEVPGLDVSIWMNGQPVKEYEDAGEEIDGPLASKSVVKYIEAISDTEFAVNFSVLPVFKEHRQTKDDLLFKAQVDGKWYSGRFMEFGQSDSRPWNRLVEGVSGVDVAGRGTLRPFKFDAINIVEATDSTKTEIDMKAAAKLGEVIVDVFRVRIGANAESKYSAQKDTAATVSEKAIKGRALSHGTTLGTTKTIPAPKISHHTNLDGVDKPLARFIFRYRSKEALRQLLIIPRTPSPDPFISLSAAERERLAREAFQQQQMSKADPGIKRERTVKRERNDSVSVDLTGDAPTVKQRKTTLQEPIDLTDE
ncbi:hypothetical protein V490_01888 [Pseudogymnoascus sp. VKM F-3557]|nr:hypothetical protein V490_01888 [Pseudogymnoascus sp. VKM F-3557]